MCVCQVVHSRDGEMIYLGTQSVLLQTGLLITRAEFVASPQQPVYITGRVEFFDVSSRVDPHKDEVCVVGQLNFKLARELAYGTC